MPATTVISIMDFNIFTLIALNNKPTIPELSESLKSDFDAKKVHSNIKKLEKNGFIKIMKKTGGCQLTATSKKELAQINKRIERISQIPKAAQTKDTRLRNGGRTMHDANMHTGPTNYSRHHDQ